MGRKLFCELSPLAYEISWIRCCMQRKLANCFTRNLAKQRQVQPLPYRVYQSNSLIRRKLGAVDPQLQENKAVNLALAAPHVNGILIKPGETFSFWYLVGHCTKKKGYQEGMFIKNGKADRGIAGGMCQMTNLIHWMVLHTPLDIVEHHHHDEFDLFPDFGRTVPFGTGTSVAYNYLDYRFCNQTQATYQLLIKSDGTYLCGELRSDLEPKESYHITTKDESFTQEAGIIYRNSKIMRSCVEKRTGNVLQTQCIKVNHAQVLYDRAYIKTTIQNK